MLKKIFVVLALILAVVYIGTAQTNNTFDGTGNVNGSGLWVLPAGGGASNWLTGAPQLDGSGNWSPYHATVVNGYSYSIYDSLIQVEAGKEVWHIVGALSGVNNTRVVGVGPTTSKTLTAACMYFGSIQQMTSATDQYVLKRMDFNMPTLGGVNPDGGATRYISHEWVVGDTLGYTVWPSNAVTLWVASAGGGRDTLAANTALYDYATLGFYPFIGGQDQTTDTKITKWGIRAAAGGGAPPASPTEVNPPVTSDGIPSSLSLNFGQLVRIDYSWTEDSTAKWFKTQWDTLGGTWMALDSIPISGQSGSVQSSYKTRYTAGNLNFRGIISDAVDKKDTSATKTVTYTAAPVVSSFNRIVGGWATFDDIRWKNMATSTGDVPSDSLPWNALTHLSLFAASGSTPIPNSYLNQIPYMTAEAHSYGVYAGLTYGGSGDAPLIAMTTNPSAWPAWINYNMNLIRTHGLDYLDFDYEGTITAAQVYAFFDVLYDSLQTATSGNNPSRKPFIVLTVGNSRAASWVSMEPFVDVVFLMTYDKIGDWWGRIIPDAMPRSTLRWTGDISGGFSAVNKTYYPAIGAANAEAPSFQAGARAVAAAGWPKEKICVGFDANPTYWFGGTFADGRGPRYLWQPTNGSVQSVGSNLDFNTTWPSISGVSFSDSIVFDTASYSYWAHQGTTQATDRVWVMQTYPGKDSGMLGSRRVVDSMNLGGIVFWNLGSEIWNTASVPTGGRGWLYRQIEQHFGSADTILETCAPPVTPTPSNGATGQILATVFNWEDRACAAASAGYQIQIDDTTDFLTPVKDTIVTPSGLTLASGYLSNGQTVRWRVRVKDAASGTWGEWSTVWSYTTIVAIPGTPALVSPVNNASNQSSNITYQWSAPVSGGPVVYYQIQVATDAGFTSLFTDVDSIPSTTTSYLVKSHTAGGTYYWRVRAQNTAGNGAYSGTRTLVVGTAAPASPILLTPANFAGNVDTVNVRHQWTTPSGAVTYHLQISTLGNFSTTLKDTFTAGASYYLATVPSNDTIYWRVKAIGSSDSSVYSSTSLYVTTLPTITIPPGGREPMTPWWNPTSLGYEYKQPPRYLAWLKGDPEMDDVPKPQDTNIVYGNAYGRKYGFTNASGGDSTDLFGKVASGSTGLTLTQIKNALADSSVFESAQIQQPILTGIGFLVKHTDTLTSWYSLFRAPSVDENLVIDLPTRPGKLALVDGEILTPQSVESKTPISAKSGALGFTPGDAYNAGTGAFFWGFAPGDTNNWTIYTLSGLRTDAGILTNSGIVGPKLAYLDANEQWQFLDTNYYRDAGSGWVNDALNDTTAASFYFYDGATKRGHIAGDAVGLFLYGSSASSTAQFGMTSAFDAGTGIQITASGGTEIKQTDSLEMVERIRTTFINSDGIEDYWQRHFVTADATPSVGLNFSLDSNYAGPSDYSTDDVVYVVEFDVIGKRNGGTGYAAFKRRMVYENVAGTVTEIAEQTIGTDVESGATDLTLAVSGDYVQATITGIAAQTWVWHIHMKILPVGN